MVRDAGVVFAFLCEILRAALAKVFKHLAVRRGTNE